MLTSIAQKNYIQDLHLQFVFHKTKAMLPSNDQKSGTVIFVKKIQTLVYPLSPSKKDGKIQAASKEAAGVDSVHSTTTHTSTHFDKVC